MPNGITVGWILAAAMLSLGALTRTHPHALPILTLTLTLTH